MTKNEVINKVRVLLGLQKFDSAVLADGTKIESDGDFAPGVELYVIDAEGNRVPAPEGEHTTESGITVTVDAEGKITGVKRPDEEGEGALAAADEEEKVEMAEEEDDKKEEMEEDLEEKAEEAMEEEPAITPEAVLEIVAPLVEEIAMMKSEVEAMKKEFEDYMEKPAAESMKKSFSKMNKSSEEVIDAYARLATLRKEFSKK